MKRPYSFVLVFFLLTVIGLWGCKKVAQNLLTVTDLQRYFDQEVLNKNFVVDLATDGTQTKTSEYAGYQFVLYRTNSYIDGPMIGFKNNDTIRGTWTSNDDYGFLTINLVNPTPPSSFEFLNRKWRFVRKNLPLMELAPYGTTDPKVLNMRRL